MRPARSLEAIYWLTSDLCPVQKWQAQGGALFFSVVCGFFLLTFVSLLTLLSLYPSKPYVSRLDLFLFVVMILDLEVNLFCDLMLEKSNDFMIFALFIFWGPQ